MNKKKTKFTLPNGKEAEFQIDTSKVTKEMEKRFGKEKTEPLNIKGSNIYATYKSQEELQAYVDMHRPEEAILLLTGWGLAVNLIVHLMTEHCGGEAIAEPTPPLFEIKKSESK